jgi:hypothetical protein
MKKTRSKKSCDTVPLKKYFYLKVTNLQCLQNMSKSGEKLGRLDHERGPGCAGELEDDLRVGDGVELGERPDEDGGPALPLQHVRVPLRHHSPDQVRLRTHKINYRMPM